MGGNYFKLGRLPKKEYLVIEKELRAILDRRFGEQMYCIPRYYGNKADFGDVDIIFSSKAIGGDLSFEALESELVACLDIKQFCRDGHLFTTVFRNFQVDFFLTPHQDMYSLRSYMDFNDLGSILGKMFQTFHLKYSGSGLEFVYRRQRDTSYKKVIFVSRDWEKILRFLGLSYDKWFSGFDTLEEMFDWVTNSPFFNSLPYLNTDKSMNKLCMRRTTPRKFIEYLSARKVDKEFKFTGSRRELLAMIEDCFPASNLVSQVEEEQAREKEDTLLKSKLNGKLVMEWFPGLNGKTLGQIMTKIHLENTRESLLSMSTDDIKEQVLKHMQT